MAGDGDEINPMIFWPKKRARKIFNANVQKQDYPSFYLDIRNDSMPLNKIKWTTDLGER